MIRDAAAGGTVARGDFAELYLPLVRRYLAHRWRGSRLRPDIDDAVQEVFVECYRTGGVLERARPGRGEGFRAFLYGVVRNVARRHEERSAARRGSDQGLDEVVDEAHYSRMFDALWARELVGRARKQLEREVADSGDREREVRLRVLELRFGEGLPVRTIAEQLDRPAEQVHRDYAKARDEFRSALREVVAFHHPDASAGELDSKCAELLELLVEKEG